VRWQHLVCTGRRLSHRIIPWTHLELAEDRRRGRKTVSASRGHADLRVSYDHDADRVSIRAHTGSWIGALSSFRSVVVQVARSLVATPATTATGKIVNIGHFLSVDRSVLWPWRLAATATSQPTTVGAQDGCRQLRLSQGAGGAPNQ